MGDTQQRSLSMGTDVVKNSPWLVFLLLASVAPPASEAFFYRWPTCLPNCYWEGIGGQLSPNLNPMPIRDLYRTEIKRDEVFNPTHTEEAVLSNVFRLRKRGDMGGAIFRLRRNNEYQYEQ